MMHMLYGSDQCMLKVLFIKTFDFCKSFAKVMLDNVNVKGLPYLCHETPFYQVQINTLNEGKNI